MIGHGLRLTRSAEPINRREAHPYAENYGSPSGHPPDAPSRAARDALSRKGDVTALFPGRYLSVTSFKRDGTGVATPVWFVSDGRRLFALTDLHSAKVRRIRRNPRVLVASCRPSGKLRGEQVSARAEVLTSTSDLERVQHLLIERYKISYRLVMLLYRVGRRLRGRRSVAEGAALAITIEPDPSARGTTDRAAAALA